ncbi:MAG: ABC transporter six-transmembrane domain-containing protein [Thiolinea sp.]
MTIVLVKSISLKSLVIRFWPKVSLTFLLVVIESLLGILYPLFIGFAINDLIAGSYEGIFKLLGLGCLSLVIGSLRRLYDTRAYAKISRIIFPEMIAAERKKGSSVSVISARSDLLAEFVDFLENSLPEIVGAVISLLGVIVIVATLNINVFFACVLILSLVLVIYLLSGKFNYSLNKGLNDQLEKEVSVIQKDKPAAVSRHYLLLMRWKVKLSDLETLNYFILWLGIIALFIYTPIAVIESGVTDYGLVMSIFMYIVDYIDRTVTFPVYIQQLIRLQEISRRLANKAGIEPGKNKRVDNIS